MTDQRNTNIGRGTRKSAILTGKHQQQVNTIDRTHLAASVSG